MCTASVFGRLEWIRYSPGVLSIVASGFSDRDLNTSAPVASIRFVETLQWTNVNCPILLCASGTPALGFCRSWCSKTK